MSIVDVNHGSNAENTRGRTKSRLIDFLFQPNGEKKTILWVLGIMTRISTESIEEFEVKRICFNSDGMFVDAFMIECLR